MGIWLSIKKKLPATFNAAEYETGRLLKDSENNTKELLKASKDQSNEILKESQNGTAKILEKSESDTAKILKASENETAKILKMLENMQTEQKRREEKLRDTMLESSLGAVAKAKSDDDFDKISIPLNKMLNSKGMAVSMHLTSVDESLHDYVYDTADVVRSSTLALLADEIRDKNVTGAAAELGVAYGGFARVINAVLPDRKLYLFDTFDGFPEEDEVKDLEAGFSKDARKNYRDISVESVLSRMPFPEKAVVRKGYFPDTAQGLEDEKYCFVNIDCDLYQPILAGLRYFYPRLEKGGYIFVHDYRSKYFRGVKKAMELFREETGISYVVLPDNTGTAVITK